ncbi:MULTISPECIES: four helix bundle protein [unclassified Lysobacter]|uniref:four helix bundle protein n=1 Tax=unclassified Lysobacter TaxID=2635362 RepID=UPI001BEBAD04|nr:MULTISPECIES: four helix bundle protein [unclassified Lysobacter]MBT2747873.1 four helix bundle protein [Lysobacter sp. ISL-42]MBT2753787.1 four helix bundle protein [Lysobacter sp. ISL-50]MBT2779075.1 four helix bundle protein [Lysobacter sp. ISL-54]
MTTDFRDLRVWREAMTLAESVYRLCDRFPTEERYGLAAQLKRAVVSVPSCIAEGNARGSTREYLRFLSMAKGSLAEVQTQVLLSARLGFIDESSLTPALGQVRAVSLLLHSLRKSLSAKLPRADHSPFPTPHSRL